jgi:hypothetical protein
MKVTIDVDGELYTAVKVEAARAGRSVREVVDEALTAWIERVEDEEDLASADAAMEEYRRDGGISVEEFYAELAAETKASYGSE